MSEWRGGGRAKGEGGGGVVGPCRAGGEGSDGNTSEMSFGSGGRGTIVDVVCCLRLMVRLILPRRGTRSTAATTQGILNTQRRQLTAHTLRVAILDRCAYLRIYPFDVVTCTRVHNRG